MLVRAWRGARHQHREGLMVEAVAGLVPCPLTLFAMFYAMARGVPEAGLAFALAMMIAWVSPWEPWQPPPSSPATASST